MKKGWLIGCGVAGVLGIAACGGIVALFFGSIFAFTQPVVDASNEFLGLLGQGNISAAYAMTSAGYQSQNDEAVFADAVKQLGLTDYASSYWNSRKINNNQGSVEGTITTTKGSTKSVSIQLLNEQGKWKIDGLKCEGVELQSLRPIVPVPSDADLEKLVTGSLLEFNQAVLAKDFGKFYEQLAGVWKKETSAEQLKKTFGAFIDNEIDIGPINNVKPRIEPRPQIDSRGALIVTGFYPTKPSQVKFELKYFHERGAWRLFGISIKVGPAEGF
jgi:hypothetical protein